MKAIATAYAYNDPDNTQPFRRISGYFSLFPWRSSHSSKTIDISLMIKREFDGVKNQTMNFTFRKVDSLNVLDLSRQIEFAKTSPEDEVAPFRRLKKICRLPRFLIYLLFQFTKFMTIRSKVMAPTSVSILSNLPGTFHNEHISAFALGEINKVTFRAPLTWTVDHRLGFGVLAAEFITHLKQVLESGEFLHQENEIR
jgi:hypothetical protein